MQKRLIVTSTQIEKQLKWWFLVFGQIVPNCITVDKYIFVSKSPENEIFFSCSLRFCFPCLFNMQQYYHKLNQYLYLYFCVINIYILSQPTDWQGWLVKQISRTVVMEVIEAPPQRNDSSNAVTLFDRDLSGTDVRNNRGRRSRSEVGFNIEIVSLFSFR